MAISVLALLEGAYTRSDANDPGKLAGDPELIAHLDRVYQRTWGLLSRARPDVFSAVATLTLSNIPPALTLPTGAIDVLHIADATGQPVTVISPADATRGWALAPVVLRRGFSLISRNLAGDPRSGDVLTITYLDAPTTLTTLGTTLDARWPVRHAQYLVDALAIYLSTKDAGRDGGEHKKLLDEASHSASALAAEYGLAPAAVEWPHAPVERSTGGGS